jgi:hypothetical protein
VLHRAPSPAQNGEPTRTAGSTKDEGKPTEARAASSGKVLSDIPALKPYWENPPYGILGRAMETSASCEARYAPLLYPTNQVPGRHSRRTCTSTAFYQMDLTRNLPQFVDLL